MSELVSYTNDDGIGIITIDNPPVNASSQPVRQALAAILASMKQAGDVKAVLLRCAGRTFMAGADIREFDGADIPLPDPNEIHALLESLPVPAIAVLHGTVLGGGLELALACHYRVALRSTRLGMPEVTLGLLPGAGGTQRLPRLIGVSEALDMIATGKAVSADRALRMGLLDDVFDADLDAQALAFARLAAHKDVAARVLRYRSFDLEQGEALVLEKWLERLPPEDKGGRGSRACVLAIKMAAELPFDEGLEFERRSFLKCKASTESKALRHAFFSEREASRIPNLPDDLMLRPMTSVGIVGAGTMGVGIAMSFANAGMPVILQDLSAETLARATEAIRTTYGAAVDKGRISAQDAESRRGLVRTATDDMQLAQCDLIIEAAFESLGIKQRIFERLGKIAKPGAILASNTSSLDVNKLADASGRPADVLGMHFFSPANIMRLLEVVRADLTAPDVLATVMRLAKRIGKVPVVSGVCFGFIGNRMLEGYLREAEFLILEGASPAFIDEALEDFGMAMGPCRMIDMAGVDVAAKVVIEQKKANILPEDPTYRVVVQALHDAGRFGQKTACGYYRYEGRKPVEDTDVTPIFVELARVHGIQRRTDITAREVVQRCLYPLIAEGYRILEEGIAYRPGDIDVVWLSGYGFPAYRGGPMFYAQTLGEAELAGRIASYAETRGNLFGYWTVPESLQRARR
ncbi:3-hydroxyacyl-CoA dehydrogenase NAD-binding domain-containing protein [Pollutimonas sp. H1-120]|uniref:3-hydroxyacyl-CoA dehydrogenase NAD-binding domain-containing protein n=1 Tax=Pollutimonas sp. H1-120 TaxID=3148824 RepID=UPI003B5260D6